MKELLSDISEAVFNFLTNRIVWLMIVTGVLFAILVGQLFYLQIVISDTFVVAPRPTSTVEQTIPAPRGNIYDRFGRPLTVNITAHVVTMDPSFTICNDALLELTRLFERNDEDFVNDFPMTAEWPYEFTLGGDTPEIRQARIFRWNDDMAVPDPDSTTAAEAFTYLRERDIPGWPAIDPEISNDDARRILNLRSQIFLRRFNPQLFEIAFDITPATMAAIEEQNNFFAGVGLELRTFREYPQGIYFTHMLGYTGRVTAEDLELFPDQGYTDYDMIGKTGLELSMEERLRGVRGTQIVEINPSTGRRITGATPEITRPIPGENIFLTIDIDMQRQTYYILKDYLTEIAIRRIQSGGDARDGRVTTQMIFTNLVTGGWLPTWDIMEADEEYQPAAVVLQRYILDRFPEATPMFDDRDRIVTLLVDGIAAGRVTPAMILAAMVDLEILTDYDDFSDRVRAGRATANSFVIEKLRMGELTPQMINIDPATGSVVVVDVHTGAVLAAVSYPSFDNNKLANRINPEYYARINGFDPTHPMINRAFVEARAPGSTFKMFTAVAGLEMGVITPTSRISDRVTFTRAGRPHVRCWGSHGSITVSQAIGISCNYFFFETAFRLGSNQHQRIEGLNKFMEFFGLNERTGVEIGELADRFNRQRTADIMSSPALKQYIHLSRNEFAPRTQWDWFDGDTVRTAIGQGYNNYSAAMLARSMAQIANRGERLPLHLVDTITNYRGDIVHQAVPVFDDTGIETSESTWDAIHRGMIATTEGWGTAPAQFRGFPIRVAGKTGTAEEVTGRPAHSSFGAFAPYEDPQIAIYVTVPFGSTRALGQVATQISRDVIYAFLMPEVVIEHPLAVNTLTR